MRLRSSLRWRACIVSKQLVWEDEHIFINMATEHDPGFMIEHHLKVVMQRPDSPRPYKVSVAWVRRFDKRKWEGVVHTDTMSKQAFRSRKAAKAWCMAVYSMEQ